MKYQKAQHKFNSRKQEVCGGRQSRNVLTLYQSAKRGRGVFMVEMLQRFAYIRLDFYCPSATKLMATGGQNFQSNTTKHYPDRFFKAS